ncbi:MAG TPA: CBS domain-containing protein [Thermoplasmata archaeon]|nr:CBS domain-containing protein [Thermoplasmata archaeon]
MTSPPDARAMPSEWPTAGDLMNPRPVTLPFDAPISEALGIMKSKGYHEIPVLQRSRLAGMITFESLARRVSRATNTKVGSLLTMAPLITPRLLLPEVAELLLGSGLRGGPVVGPRGELLGVISRTNLVGALADHPEFPREPVDRIGSPATVTIREEDTVRHLQAQIRLLEEHPLPVVDRKGRLVGAVGVADLASVLWRPDTGGKRDLPQRARALDVRVSSFMRSPAVTVASKTHSGEAARKMTDSKVSSVFVVEDGHPTRVVAQADLLGLVVGAARTAKGPGRIEDCYVEVTGLRGSSDPALLADIDHLVAQGLKRIARHLHPSLFSLHLSPHSTHRTADITAEGRLHTDAGIFYASQTGWNLMAGVSGIMEELAAQVQRDQESRRERVRSRRRSPTDETVEDADLERRIRVATGDDE